MPHPIGYYIAARQEHPAFPVLQELETSFGSYFQNFGVPELQSLLIFCSAYCLPSASADWDLEHKGGSDNADYAIELLSQLEPSFLLGFVPFLFENIQQRYQEVAA